MQQALLSLMIICLFVALQLGAAVRHTAQPIEPVNQSFIVDGLRRTALIYPNAVPAPKTGAPLLLVFHGHGGRVRGTARRFNLQGLWPEAVVAYLQGLPGVVGITDAEGKLPGWQKNPGELSDRDVKFVDAALDQIQKQYKTDPNRVYALGHSNGARFVNVLWKMRAEKFAAFCSAAGQGGLMLRGATPKPIFIIAGEKDQLVPYRGQLLSVELIRRLLETDSSKAKTEGYLRTEPGINGTELMTYLHPGGHEFPQAALPLAVRFFKRHTKH
jgi:polyhydroxybutyrate depolymerase